MSSEKLSKDIKEAYEAERAKIREQVKLSLDDSIEKIEAKKNEIYKEVNNR